MTFLINRPRREYFDSTLQRTFDKFYDDFFKESNPFQQLGKATYPRCNIINKKDSVLIQAAIPGLTKEDIEVEIDNRERVITLRSSGNTDHVETDDDFIAREIKFSSFVRSFSVSDSEMDLDNVTASCKDGVLELTIPRNTLADAKAVTRKIDIK